MRVIAGRYKGRRLQAPAWSGLRPTSDRLKESLFGILAPVIDGARVLDVFAGSGALGIEALSRGAAAVCFVESDRRAVDLIEANLRHCGIADGYTMARGEFPAALDGMVHRGQFDLILLDPPYDADGVEETLETAALRLAAGGTMVLEHAARRTVPARAGSLGLMRQVKAGDSALAFYRQADVPLDGATEDL